MKYNPLIHHRKSIRLQNYDYSQAGAYFITICTQHRQHFLGEIIQNEMRLNEAGTMILQQWETLPQRFSSLQLDAFVIMPNHIHGILVLDGHSNKTLADIVGAFKSITTNEYIKGVKQYHWQSFDRIFWQRNYYEHIIRNEQALNQIREYIVYNPISWAQDENNVM